MEKLLNAIKEHDSKEGNHQSILNVGYAKWQEDNNDVNTYEEMVDWMAENYGSLTKLFILLGKYNQQVTNGGHIQYYDNAYATGNGGCFDNHNGDISLHEEMVELFNEYKLDDTDLGKTVSKILNEFVIELDDEEYYEDTCYECCGGQVDNPEYDPDDEDSDEEEYIDCPECENGYVENYNENYGGVSNNSTLSNLDDRYYEVDEEWMKYLEGWLKNKLGL